MCGSAPELKAGEIRSCFHSHITARGILLKSKTVSPQCRTLSHGFSHPSWPLQFTWIPAVSEVEKETACDKNMSCLYRPQLSDPNQDKDEINLKHITGT